MTIFDLNIKTRRATDKLAVHEHGENYGLSYEMLGKKINSRNELIKRLEEKNASLKRRLLLKTEKVTVVNIFILLVYYIFIS